jgi:predicted transcriptional regulator of viral defense system
MSKAILIDRDVDYLSLQEVKWSWEVWFVLAHAAADDNCVEVDEESLKRKIRITDDQLRDALSFCLQKGFLEAIPERGVYRVNHRKSV